MNAIAVKVIDDCLQFWVMLHAIYSLPLSNWWNIMRFSFFLIMRTLTLLGKFPYHIIFFNNCISTLIMGWSTSISIFASWIQEWLFWPLRSIRQVRTSFWLYNIADWYLHILVPLTCKASWIGVSNFLSVSSSWESPFMAPGV